MQNVYNSKLITSSLDGIKKIASFTADRARRWGPQIYRISTASKGISSFVTAFNVSFKVMPVVMSILPLLSTVPILHYLVPSSVILTFMITPLIIIISLVAGLASYKEAVERTRIDTQAQDDHQKLVEAQQLITKMNDQLQELFHQNKQLTLTLNKLIKNSQDGLAHTTPSTSTGNKVTPY